MKSHKTIIIGFIVLSMLSCKTDNNRKTEIEASNSMNKVNQESTKNESVKLKSLLNKRSAEFEKAAPENIKKEYSEGISSVRNSGILERALKVGDKVPNFELKNHLSNPVRLSEELRKGPVVLMWYRGGWCPYCNINLRFLQEKLPEFKKLGASLLALSPELPDKSLNTTEKNKLEFQVLSDVGNKVARQYGVVFKLTPEVATTYQKAFDMHAYNGDDSNELPLAATYVIDQDGIIKYTFLDADYRNRAEPSEILQVLSELRSKKQ